MRFQTEFILMGTMKLPSVYNDTHGDYCVPSYLASLYTLVEVQNLGLHFRDES